MQGGLVRHIIKIPAALSLPLLRGDAVCRAPTIFQNYWFCTRISNFFQSPIISIDRLQLGSVFSGISPMKYLCEYMETK